MTSLGCVGYKPGACPGGTQDDGDILGDTLGTVVGDNSPGTPPLWLCPHTGRLPPRAEVMVPVSTEGTPRGFGGHVNRCVGSGRWRELGGRWPGLPQAEHCGSRGRILPLCPALGSTPGCWAQCKGLGSTGGHPARPGMAAKGWSVPLRGPVRLQRWLGAPQSDGTECRGWAQAPTEAVGPRGPAAPHTAPSPATVLLAWLRWWVTAPHRPCT